MSKIDLSDIKKEDLDNTISFTDLMSRSERKRRQEEKKNELKESLSEKVEKINETIEPNNEEKLEKTIIKQTKIKEEKEENLLKTQALELTRQMKFNIQDNIEEEKKEKIFNPITDIGIFILVALGYFIYALLFTNYLDNTLFLLIDACVILFMFLLFGITIITTKRNNKVLEGINFLILILYLTFNILITLGFLK